MNLTQMYRALLRLYPRDYRAVFAEDMSRAFELAAEERRGQGRLVWVRFVLTECMGLLTGAGAQWTAKLTRNRTIQERRPEFSRELSFAEAGVRLPTPDELIEAERRVAALVDGMVHAIATHDFPKARSCSYEEREAREELRRLKEKYGIGGGADFGLLG